MRLPQKEAVLIRKTPPEHVSPRRPLKSEQFSWSGSDFKDWDKVKGLTRSKTPDLKSPQKVNNKEAGFAVAQYQIFKVLFYK